MSNHANFVRKTILSCSLSLGAGLLCIGALAGFIAVLPIIAEWCDQTWFLLSGMITDGGTSVTPAAYIQWASLLVAVWSVSISMKLYKVASGWCAAFGGLAVICIVLGVIPSQFAIMEVCGDWAQSFISAQPFVIQTAVSVAALMPCIGFLLFILFLVWGMGQSGATEPSSES